MTLDMTLSKAAVIVALACCASLSLADDEYQLNQALVDNELEGLELIAELEQELLANPNVSLNAPNKTSSEAASDGYRHRPQSVGSGSFVPLVPSINVDYGAGAAEGETTPDDLDHHLVPITDSKECCKVIVPPHIVSFSQNVSYACTTYYQQVSHRHCGLFGWSRCTRRSTRSRTRTCYREDVTYSTVEQPCPEDKETCCEAEVWFRKGCVLISQLRALLDWLIGGAVGEPPYTIQ